MYSLQDEAGWKVSETPAVDKGWNVLSLFSESDIPLARKSEFDLCFLVFLMTCREERVTN